MQDGVVELARGAQQPALGALRDEAVDAGRRRRVGAVHGDAS